MSKKDYKKKSISTNISQQETKPKKEKDPLVKFFSKFIFLCIVILLLIIYSDKKGYFNPDYKNDQTHKKWNAFYDFALKNDVDILLLGNSHLYTGINPKNLSSSLGANAFILANPGTFIGDSYFALKEALKLCSPKIVIVETYCINDYDPYESSKLEISDQLKSFSARKNAGVKLISTPFLFSYNNYFYAWSNTIRNHDFIFNDKKQIKENTKLYNKKEKNKQLYLGRYVRFTSGLKDSILNKYATEGAPVNGLDYGYNSFAQKYIRKISELCEKESIELVFLTLPMYHKHVENYEIWRDNLYKIIKNHNYHWIDFQKNYSFQDFKPECFENTYEKNQHMSYRGSLLATYKLADYIRDSLGINLPDRSHDQKWINVFYNEEGYFENHSPISSDKVNKIIVSNKPLRNCILKEVISIRNTKANNTNSKTCRIYVKVDKNNIPETDFSNTVLRLLVKLKNKSGDEKTTIIDFMYDKYHTNSEHLNYIYNLNPDFKVIDIMDGIILLKTPPKKS